MVKNPVTVEKQSDRSNISTNSVGVGTLELVKLGGPLNLEENLLVVGVGDLDVKSIRVCKVAKRRGICQRWPLSLFNKRSWHRQRSTLTTDLKVHLVVLS